MKILITLAVCLLLAGCKSTYQAIVTVTEVRFAVMNELGEERRAGRINDEDWQKVVEMDEQYRFAANAAADALTIYQQTGQGDPGAILRTVKASVTLLIDTLARYQVVFAEKQNKNLSKATNL